MQLTFNFDEKNIKIEDGRLIITIDSKLESKLLILNQVKLSDVKTGSIIKGKTETEWIVFRHEEDGTTKLLRKNLLDNTIKFDSSCNNFGTSSIRNYLNTKYIKDVESDFGKENLLYHEINLMALNGTLYDSVREKISIPTLDDYRWAVANGIITENINTLWWLATPSSYSSDYVTYVSSNGYVDCYWCGNSGAVRPFISLPSNIFVSLKK